MASAASPPSSPPPPLDAFTLPSPSFPSPLSITSFLPSSPPFTCLALFLSNSTTLLYPSITLPSPSLPSITLPSPSFPSLSTFSLLKPSNKLLFFSFSPSNSTPIAYHLNGNQFAPILLKFKDELFSPLLPFTLGFSIKSSHNLLAIHSIAASQIWILFINLNNEGETNMVELKKCAVIELVNPVYDLCLDFGCLVLGEREGVRVFNLRKLVKGREWNERQGKRLLNGVLDVSENKKETRLRTSKIKQNTKDYSFFMNIFGDKSKNKNPINAVSIYPFSKKTFIILDSTGYVHLFIIKNNSGDFIINPVNINNMKVKLVAIAPNLSSMFLQGHKYFGYQMANIY